MEYIIDSVCIRNI